MSAASPFTPLPWERILWTARPWPPRRTLYLLSDLRFLVVRGDRVQTEIPVDEIVGLDVQAWRFVDRPIRRRSLRVTRRPGVRAEPPIVLERLSRRQMLALAQQLVGRQAAELVIDPALVEEEVRTSAPVWGRAIAAAGLAAAAVTALAIQLQGEAPSIAYPPNDAIYPRGVKRSPDEIVRFMEREVMPWARRTLGPVVGGAHRVTCATCHGADGGARGWAMPGVSELPYPRVRASGGAELYAWLSPDPQLRNAVYADLAQDDRQATAAYMRQVVMPGMARLLGRPAYDFAAGYGANRTRFAFGCYHCHRVR